MTLLRFPLLLSVTALLLLSSCASVFQGRNYAHLDYVKVKDHHASPATGTQAMGEDDRMALAAKTKKVLPQHPFPGEYLRERTFADHLGVITSGMSLRSTAQTEVSPGAVYSNVPQVNERHRKKLESATNQLFGDMDHDLRLGLILIIAGILVALLVWIPTIGWIFGVAATLLVLIGLVYIIKYVVEKG